MRVICSQNAVGLRHWDDPLIAGWLQVDEPDNVPSVPRADVLTAYERMRRWDATRPVMLNFGQGVANREFRGRGVPYSYYREVIWSSDIASFDVYPVAGVGSEALLWYVARGVDSLKVWSRGTKPIWNFIETTRINSRTRKATPQQVRAEVWMSLIHGSQGIVYFVHEWQPRFVEARLLEDEAMLAAVTRINREILELAPVLNSPTLDDAIAVASSAEGVPIDALVKVHGDHLYIFSAPMRKGATRGTFRLPERTEAGRLAEISQGRSSRRVEVLGEGRTIELTDGQFSDDFATYEVHLYRIPLSPATAVLEMGASPTPGSFGLKQNYPNPFNSTTAIPFVVPESGWDTELAVYNLAGQQVAALAGGVRSSGQYVAHWNGRDSRGAEVASGIYLYRLRVGSRMETRRLLLLR